LVDASATVSLVDVGTEPVICLRARVLIRAVVPIQLRE
jgi:hypothetical protein